ncbi:unnamed protein product [Moneuplotes crassus]|uniref:Ubiquitin-like domain-containing protein n=1 Tax=Euplotes crassus TaxID=5936 RepID=A0AAD1X7D7_EUPCR|nr:unnamed protein product [Moneuplotes crassus]
MQRPLHINLSQIPFPSSHSKDPIQHNPSARCPCGMDSVQVCTKDNKFLCRDCAEMSGHQVMIDFIKLKKNLNHKLNKCRQLISQNSLYLEYKKNFISQKCYDQALKNYQAHIEQHNRCVQEITHIFEKISDQNAQEIQQASSRVDVLIGDIENPPCNRDLEAEMRTVYVQLIEEVNQIEDPEDSENLELDLVSVIYTLPEYEEIRMKLRESEELRNKYAELRVKYEKLGKVRSRGVKGRRDRKTKKKILKSSTIFSQAEILPKRIKILIKLPGDETLSMKVSQTDPISIIKHKIFKIHNIPTKDQKLTFLLTELQDKNLVNDYKIQTNSVLKLSIKPSALGELTTLSIHTDDGIKYNIKVALEATVYHIKNKISSTFNNPVTDKILILHNTPLNDRRTLLSYNYTQGDILYLEDPKITLRINLPNNKILTTEIRPEETIKSLKETLHDQNILKDDTQKLYFNNTELKSVYKTIKQVGIQQGSDLYLF